MFQVDSKFIGSFKVGDNIHRNLELLDLLYEFHAKASKNEKDLLVKPILITLVSVTEAIIYDFYFRVVEFTREGVNGISNKVAEDIRSKKISDFEKLIACVRKHNVFKRKTPGYYNYLDEVRRLRNRVHIQNKKGEFDRDEAKVFTEARKVQAEKVLEMTLKIMADQYSRAKHLRGVPDFALPWDEHFSSPIQISK